MTLKNLYSETNYGYEKKERKKFGVKKKFLDNEVIF